MRNLLRTVVFAFLLIIYNYFFWSESFGINLPLFTLVLILVLLKLYPGSLSSRNVLITLTGTLITGVMVAVFNSVPSKIGHLVSFFLFAAFMHEHRMRSFFYALAHLGNTFFKVPQKVIHQRDEILSRSKRLSMMYGVLKHSLFPLLIATVFYLIYMIANPVFKDFGSAFFQSLFDFIADFFRHISISRIFFLLTGAVILSGVLFRSDIKTFLDKDLSFSEKLQRVRKNKRRFYIPQAGRSLLSLKNENRRGVLLLILLNILLLAENIIDIKLLWFGFSVTENFSLKDFVHNGAGLLIFSILLSIGILLFYFRGNQNFYLKNKTLRMLAYIWVFQNAVLLISVFIRNYHYIDFHGLAYKRIGVYVFLALTLVGLITLFLKIRDRKTLYHLLRLNTLSVYFMLVALSLVNWDVHIARYNVNHWNKGEIDVDFYLDLSPKAFPVVYANLEKIKQQIEAHNSNKVKWIDYLDYTDFVNALNKRSDRFIKRYENDSWLSFNVQDEAAYKVLRLKADQTSEKNTAMVSD